MAYAENAPAMKVKCNVTNCAHYQDNYCIASALEINPMGDGYAETSEGTACTTFKNRDRA